MNIENYERAFTLPRASRDERCNCGRIFFDGQNGGWDWEDGEYEKYLNDPNATVLTHSASAVMVQGTEYATDCDCWHEIATKVMNFLDANRHGIAEYFKLERERLQSQANSFPILNI